MNRLDQILSVKRAEVERLRPFAAQLESHARSASDYRGFRAALQRSDKQLAVIAEIKKASPSAGVIASDFNPVAKARDYERAGAEAVSVLTDQMFFQGKVADLTAVHDAISIPVL